MSSGGRPTTTRLRVFPGLVLAALLSAISMMFAPGAMKTAGAMLEKSMQQTPITLPGANSLGGIRIPVYGLQLDLDTRPDMDGLQSSMTAVKDFPSGIRTLVGQPGLRVQPELPQGAVVKAEISGPAYGDKFHTVEGPPNGLMELPNLRVSGDYALRSVRLEDVHGNVILRRDSRKDRIRIKVIKKLLVTQVTSRALRLDEIREKGIVIDEKNFTAVNFTVGLTLGSEKVEIDMPIAIPAARAELTQLRPPDLTRLPSVQRAFDKINIPNFSLSGFQMRVPPDLQESEGIQLPPINGVIVIPGNIGFLNQFFSVILQATNVAPKGSKLILQGAKANIVLPLGKDGIEASGDDPLRIAETRDHGVQEVLPLLDSEGQDSIVPQATNQTEFLVEGLNEGTHRVNFDITGDLFIPQLGKTLPMTGEAGGLVQVRNPTFNITLAHPDVVREGEAYSIFATVTNTSSSPANLFQLGLNTRSMSGARMDDAEEDLKKLESLGPGQAESFEFRLVAMTTGQVTGTIFLADEGINGSFILTTGVGDTGIPLSPDTLVLPKEARNLPKQPDLLFQAVRLLGQAYSVATAPAGTLPPEIPRIRKSFVFDQAIGLAQAGLRTRFGQSALGAARDIAMDYLGADITRLDQLYPDDKAAREQRRGDLVSFDVLRRLADAGHDFSAVMGQMLAAQMTDPAQVAGLQAGWAEVFASRPAHLSFGVSSQGPPLELQITDAEGKALGRLLESDPIRRELSYAGRLPLFAEGEQSAALLLLTAPESDSYEMEFNTAPTRALRASLILPTEVGMERILFPQVALEAGAHGVIRWQRDGSVEPGLELDIDGDGRADQRLEPETRVAVQDRGPNLLGVRQWSKGAQPNVLPSFERGDPLGRMVGVLYDEPVDENSATDPALYQVADNQITQIAMQPDRRLLFMVLEKPVGPFVQRELTVSGVTDIKGNRLEDGLRIIAPDPDRGIGGQFKGQVVHADGRPVPFATVKYIQPLEKQALLTGGCMGSSEVRDAVITTYETDQEGRFNIDYVLQADFPSDCPDNVDIWLNEHSPPSTQNFKLEATDPQTGEIGKASTRMHFDGQSMGLKVVIRGYGTIKGQAVAEDGTPIVGGDPGTPDALWVRARNISTGEWFSTWVDADGRYSFPNEFTAKSATLTLVPRMPTGNVILQLVRPGDGYTAVTTTNLPGGGSTVTQDLLMIPPNRYSKVSGRVMEADGVTGAANVRVQIAGEVLTGIDLYSRSYGQSVVGSTHTDKYGNFHFDSIPTGPVDVRAFRQATYERARVESRLEEGEEQSLVLIFPGTGGTVRGLVRNAFGTPVAGATVAGGPTLTEADESGFFEINDLPLGTYMIYAQSKDSPALGQVKVQTLGPKDLQDVVITLQPLGSVAGSVYEADGATLIPSQRVQLWAEPNKGVLAETVSDGQGSFRFDEYPLGKYSVRAVRRDHGDGGMTYTSLRYAGDVRDADIIFRGMGEIRGRVIQSNGTPVLSDVIVTGKVWHIISSREGEKGNLFMEFVRSVQSQVDEGTAEQIEDALQSAGLSEPPANFFMLADESRLISSDIKGQNDEVTGKFRFANALAGSYRVAAFGPFLAPAEKTLEIPRTTDARRRRVDAGDVVLEPATGRVRGTVYMPDGKTTVGAGVTVRIRSLDSSGSVMSARGGVSQPVLPEYSVTTDGNGRFYFPLVLRGRFNLVADTGTPERGLKIKSAEEIQTARFADEDGKRLLNVRLYGSANGVVPAGETLETVIRLLDAAGITLKVVENDGKTPVPLAQVSLHTESTLDADEEAAMARLFTDKQGLLELYPVIEGRFSIRARQPFSPARGRTEGVINQGTEPGMPLASTLTLGAVTTATGQVIEAKVFGSVQGRVLNANGSTQTNPVQVTVKAAGASLLASTDDNGLFTVTDVPGGNLRIEAFEPFTARRGEASSKISRQDEKVNVTLKLVGLGTVGGTVLSSDGKRKMKGLDVILYPTGRFSDRLISRSDTQGVYELPGVPIGRYKVSVKDYENGLTGEAEGEVKEDNERRTTDVLLEPSGQIRGTVYAPGVRLSDAGEPVDADGNIVDTAPRADRATVVLNGPKTSQTLQTDEQGVFESSVFLPLGKYQITVTPQEGNDGAVTNAVLEYNGEREDIALAMSGHGSLEGVVLDSAGEKPIKAARVRLHSKSPFSRGELTRFTEKDGRFLFDQVPVGVFEIQIRTTIAETELGASVQGRVQRHGQVIAFAEMDDTEIAAIRLQPSGTIRGRVLHDDGQTAVARAVVELQGDRISLGRETDTEGKFQFDVLPLGDYWVSILDTATNGVASRRSRLQQNGQLIDYENITLDSEPPAVVSTRPKPNTTAVDGNEAIHIRFSEALGAESINARTFQVIVDGEYVAGQFRLDDDLLGVTFTPARPIPDLKQVRVVIKADTIGFEGQVLARGVQDKAGVGLREDLQFVYTTRDATPPALVVKSPDPDAKGIGLDQVVRLEFSEAMQPGPLQAFRLLQNGESLQGRLDIPPRYEGRVLIFTPRRRFEPNARFQVQIAGPLTDMAGNALPEGAVDYRFDTLDTRPPNIRSVSLDTGVEPIEGKRVQITADLEDELDVDMVEFHINSQLVGSASEPPWTTSVYLDPALGRDVVVEAVARDTSGNRSSRQRLPLRVATNTPPTVRIVSPGSTQVSAGQVIALQVAANDDVGLKQLAFTANQGGLAGGRQGVDRVSGAQAAFSFKIPADHPIGSQIELQALATDTQGLVAASAPVKLSVLGKLPPEVYIANPANGISVDPATEVNVTIYADDPTGITELSLSGSGLMSFSEVAKIEPAIARAKKTFKIRIPDDAPATKELTLAARALDSRKNAGNRSITLRINDRIAPTATLTKHWGDETRVEPGKQFSVKVDVRDEIGVTHYEIILDGEPLLTADLKSEKHATQYPNVAVPADRELEKELKLTVRVQDEAGNVGASEPLLLTASDLTSPTVSVESSVAKDEHIKAGETLTYTLKAEDVHGLAKLSYVVSGPIKGSEEFQIADAGKEAEKHFEFEIPAEADVGSDIRMTWHAWDLAGNHRSITHYVNVLDEVQPEVIEIFPLDGEKNAVPDANLRFQFSEYLNKKSVSKETLLITGPDGAVEGGYSFHYYRPDIVYFHPKPPLTRGVKYQVHITHGITDRTGNQLKQEVKTAFVTDNTPPVLVEQYPAENTDGIPAKPVIRLAFGEKLKRATTGEGAIKLLDEVGEEIPTDLRLKDDDKVIELHPKGFLKLATVYQINLSGTITDLAGNPIVLKDGKGFESRITRFTTGSLRFVSPMDGDTVRENTRIPLRISGEGMDIGDVVYEVNGKIMTPVPGPDFSTFYRVPQIEQTDTVDVLAIARDKGKKEIARRRAIARVIPGLRHQPPILGITTDGQSVLRLLLPQSQEKAITIAVSTADTEIASVPRAKVTIPAGRRMVDVLVRGGKAGNTWLHAASDQGDLYAGISVNESVAGRELLLNSPAAALSISPAPAQRPNAGVVHTGIGIAWSSFDVLPAMSMPNLGSYDLRIPVPPSVPEKGRQFELSSGNETVVTAPGAVQSAPGAHLLPITFKALAKGTTWVDMVAEGVYLRVPVHVQTPSISTGTGVASIPAGVSVSPSGFSKRLHLTQLGKRSLAIPLLREPAAADVPVQVQSSDPSILGVTATSSVPAGSRDIVVDMDAAAPGRAVVRLQAGDLVTRLAVSVLDLPVDFTSGIASRSPGLSVAMAGSGGTLYMTPGTRQAWTIRLPGITDKGIRNAVIESRNPELVVVETNAIPIPAGRRDYQVTLLAKKDVSGEAVLDVRLGSQTETMRVVVIGAGDEQQDWPVMVSPAVGVEKK